MNDVPSAPTHQSRIAGFDGMRAIAIVMVFLDHRVDGVDDFFLGGYGVHTFFVLSGFLIVGQLHQSRLAVSQGRQTVGAAWKSFMLRRAARIFPLYYGLAALMLMLPLVGYANPLEGERLPIYLLFLTNIYIEQTQQWMGAVSHVWSLAIEEQFYILAAPLILLIPPQHARTACIVVAAAAFAWTLYMIAAGRDVLMTYMNSLSNFGLIAIGGAVALRQGRSRAEVSVWLQPLLLIGLLALPLLGPAIVNDPGIRQLGQPLLAALLLAEMRDHQGTRVVRLLETRLLVQLGTISYGFYMLHPLIGPEEVRVATFGLLDMEDWHNIPQAALLFCFTAGAAAVSWRFLERPIVRLAKRAQSARGSGTTPLTTVA